MCFQPRPGAELCPCCRYPLSPGGCHLDIRVQFPASPPSPAQVFTSLYVPCFLLTSKSGLYCLGQIQGHKENGAEETKFPIYLLPLNAPSLCDQHPWQSDLQRHVFITPGPQFTSGFPLGVCSTGWDKRPASCRPVLLP